MRNLTKTEIDDAPDWATHYDIGDFEDKNCVCYQGHSFVKVNYYQYAGGMKVQINRLTDEAKSIPRKEFDIETFDPGDMVKFYIDSDGDLEFDGYDDSYIMRRDSAIAIAKHFKLTAEDLK